eukprot:1125273-Pleurochrysis_carterae.AAC.1
MDWMRNVAGDQSEMEGEAGTRAQTLACTAARARGTLSERGTYCMRGGGACCHSRTLACA